MRRCYKLKPYLNSHTEVEEANANGGADALEKGENEPCVFGRVSERERERLEWSGK